MKIEKQDGTIEIKRSTCGCCPPPGRDRPGMHLNERSLWWRTTGRTWNRVPEEVSEPKQLAEDAENCEEFELRIS